MVNKLKEIFLFENLSKDVLEKIAKETTLHSYKSDTIIFYEGDKAKYLYILKKGDVKLYKTLANANEFILKYFSENELLAELAVLEGIDYPATAATINEVELLKIDFFNLKELFFAEPEILLKMQVSLIKKIKNLEAILSRYLVLDAKGRVLDYLLKNEEEYFSHKQNEIASLLNIAPETLSRILKPLKNQDIIDTKNKRIDKEKLKIYKN